MTQTDYSECEKEILDRTGAFQSQGAVLLIDSVTYDIVGASENWYTFTQNSERTWPDSPIEMAQLLKYPSELNDVTSEVSCLTPSDELAHRKKNFELHAIRSEDFIFIEWIPVTVFLKSFKEPLFEDVDASQQNIYKTLHEMTKTIKEALSLDRVMIYRFDKDYSGDIIAETCRKDWTAYLGLHYPATDIPESARQLYLKVPYRQVYDSASPSTSLLTLPAYSAASIDLTPCSLRSVSSYHLEYLQNMGVRSSLSVAIIYKGKLWGLIACHHNQPLGLSLCAKAYLMQAATFIQKCIETWVLYQQVTERERVAKIFSEQKRVLNTLTKEQSLEILESLLLGTHGLESLSAADAAAIYVDGIVAGTGNCPNAQWIQSFVTHWTKENTDEDAFFMSQELNKESMVPTDFSDETSGMIALRVSVEPAIVIFAFRQAYSHELHWGGDPNQQISGKLGYSPRRSFQMWKETVLNKAKQWSSVEIELFKGFKQLLLAYFKPEEILPILKQGARELSGQMERQTYLTKALTNNNYGLTVTAKAVSGEPVKVLNVSHGLKNAFGSMVTEKNQEDLTLNDLLFQLGLNQEQADSLNGIYQHIELWSPYVGHRVVKVNRRNIISLSDKGKHYRIFSIQVFDITLEERMNSSLRSAHRQTNDANDAKMKFLTQTSHELIVPLRKVLNLSKRLDNELKEIQLDDLNLYTEQITDASKHMLNRVEQRLFFARSTNDNLLLNVERLNLSFMMNECIQWLKGFSQKREVVIKSDSENEIWVMGNKETLQHMLVNIIDNAVRYSHPGSAVYCRIKQNQKAENILLEIEDHGKGIAETELSKVFLPFYVGNHIEQLDSRESAGVGLTLAKCIIEAHKGYVNLDSNINIGTQVQIVLPKFHTQKTLEMNLPRYN